MLSTLIRTKPGESFVQFMRSPRGKAIDKFLVKYLGWSLLVKVFCAKVGYPPHPVLMIYTTGRKSGEERSTVMPYMNMDGRIYVIGSNGAKPNDPFWVENLRAKSDARITIKRKNRPVQAREVVPESPEYQEVWRFAATQTSQYNTYQNSTSRKIPIMALEQSAERQ